MSKSYLKFLCTASTTNMETDDVFSSNTYANEPGETPHCKRRYRIRFCPRHSISNSI